MTAANGKRPVPQFSGLFAKSIAGGLRDAATTEVRDCVHDDLAFGRTGNAQLVE